MAEPIVREVDHLIRRAKNISCEDQHMLASVIAANIGYQLTPDNPAYDEPDPIADLQSRVGKLEDAVRELNPGLAR